MAKIGVVVLNYNTYDITKNCIDSIMAMTSEQIDLQIYLVDNNSKDQSGKRLEKLYNSCKKVSCIYALHDCGNSEGWNLGIKKALIEKCDYIFCLDSDILFLNDALTYMLKALEHYQNIVVVGPALVDQNKTYIQYAGDIYTAESMFYSIKGIGGILSKITGKQRRIWYDVKEDFVFQGMFSGCCMGFKSTFLEKIGCLDENVRFYHEEDILGHQVRQLGKYSCICANAAVMHLCGATTAENVEGVKSFRRLYTWTGSVYVLKKYAKTSDLHLRLVVIEYIIAWLFLALLKREYRNKSKLFFREMRKMLTVR